MTFHTCATYSYMPSSHNWIRYWTINWNADWERFWDRHWYTNWDLKCD